MELDELQRAWSRLDERMASQGQLLARLQRQRGMDAVRSRLRWMSLGQLLQLGAGVAIVLWAASYWYEHRADVHLVVYGLALHAYGLGHLLFAVTQLLLLASVDYHAPVVAVQRKLHQLGRLRALSARVMLATGMVAWVPLFLVAMRGIGLDLWLTRPGVVWINLGVGLGMAVGVEWYLRCHPERCRRESAGALLRRAEAELDELAQPGAEGVAAR